MYYKDDYIEFRLGIGIQSFKKIGLLDSTLTLIRLGVNEPDENVITFSTLIPFIPYPSDGNYKLLVEPLGEDSYYVYFTVNDEMIREYVNQINEVICKCPCDDELIDCNSSKPNLFAMKRQRLFNLTSIMPYTIKPFYYGQSSPNNPYLFKFFQLYFNESMDEKRIQLGIEYFKYYISGGSNINVQLFKEITAIHYYSLYYYSLKFLTSNALSDIIQYEALIKDFFNFKALKDCLGCSTIVSNIEAIMDEVFLNPCFCEGGDTTVVPIKAKNVEYLVPYTFNATQTIFNTVIPIDSLLQLIIPVGVLAKTLNIITITDTLNTTKQGNNLVTNLTPLVLNLPITTIPIKSNYSLPITGTINYNSILTCYVVDSAGVQSNGFTINLKFVYDGKVLEDVFSIGFRLSELIVYKGENEFVFALVNNLGNGISIESTVWTVESVTPNVIGSQPTQPYNPNYGFFYPDSTNNTTNKLVNATPGYTYKVRLTATNDGVPAQVAISECLVIYPMEEAEPVTNFPVFYGSTPNTPNLDTLDFTDLTSQVMDFSGDITLEMGVYGEVGIIAIPASAPIKTKWYMSQFNQDIIKNDGFIRLPVLKTKNSPAVIIEGVEYRIYITNYPTVIDTIILKN